MESSPISPKLIDGEKVETVIDFIFLGSEITVDGNCSHVIKRRLLLGRKAITNLNSILKSRDITWLTKVHRVKAMVFQIVMYGCELDYKEGWALKNWGFQTVVLEKTLERPLDSTKRSNQSILKEINSEYSLQGLMLKQKLQYFGHLMQRASSLQKTWCWERLGQEGKGGNRGWNGWLASPTQWIWMWINYGSWGRMGKPGMLQSMGSQRVGCILATEQQQEQEIAVQILFSRSLTVYPEIILWW